jgi:V-ATPase subunit H
VLSPTGGPESIAAVVNGLGAESVHPFLDLLVGDGEPASTLALALGKLLGSKLWVSSSTSAGTELVMYAEKVSILLEHLRDLQPDESVTDEVPINVSMLHIENPLSMSNLPIDMQRATGSVSTARDEQLCRCLSGVASFMTHAKSRVLFCKHPSALSVLTSLLEREGHRQVQVTYQSIFCLWLLSFVTEKGTDPESFAVLLAAIEQAAITRLLIHILQDVEAEKVVRITLATLRNIMPMSTKLRKEMVALGMDSILQSRRRDHWHDPDITENLAVLAEAIDAESASMSTFDVYRHEILSGALDWTPAHRDENFWRLNVEKHEDDNLEVLRCLVRLLNESTDSKVLSVACHDLSQFIKYHRRGRFIVHSLNVRTRLMELMVAGDVEVRRYALNTVQVLMISNWSLIQAADQGGRL